ncbi:hypothetical protein ACIOEW_36325 [Streptomyces sp. NPDC087901]|uniref:hypothetical protein n=1 Tax=Streptomyces sp. NPDC087901 TaxID=3365818 RepID=UPI003808C766
MASTQARHTRRAVLPAAMSDSAVTPRSGIADDMSRDDDARGYERDETDQFHQVVRHLVIDGDDRARAAGRQARRTLADMVPGYARQPVLRLTRQLTFRASDQCQPCGGQGGRMVDTSSDGVTRQHWQSCTSCSGSGVTR